MKFHKNKIVLKNMQCRVSFHANSDKQSEMRKAINLSVLGKECCNIVVEGKGIVRDPSIDDKTDKYLANAHHQVAVSQDIILEFDLTESGEFVNLRVPKRVRKTVTTYPSHLYFNQGIKE